MGTTAFAIPFDTLAFAKELEAAGIPPAHAEAQAKALSSVLQKVEESRLQELATKGDVRELELRLETTKAELQKEIEVAKNETIKWMVGLALAQLAMMAGILMTLVRVLPGGH
ncbi:coiled-coil domain-containing protein [Candidatus Magnetaquicoccus inordinatus]|uniref:coiled-coil domain-containing protein n=1 Tax=Candidatus Magnetaquicoccus inordinatus TaxID=2496818 RepID=UPI00102C2419|nr:coiled-coil domain-containing protein [Candidatus Magnetaquicoccus inordinatus]